jgi:FtsP/CotA-like multicopper oxidase with cupredoxin domain
VEPGESFRYDFQIHPDHPSGTFWYHPHRHGSAADQVFGGLYGAIIIADLAALELAADRVLLVSDISLDANGAVASASAMQRMTGREGDLVLVNGQARPHLEARAGARERWRIVNSCVSRYLRLRLDGQNLRLIGVDLPLGGQIPQIDELLLAPGNRADLIVTTRLGASSLQALPYDRGSMGMGMGSTGSSTSGVLNLATLAVTGITPPALPDLDEWPAVRDLRTQAVTTHRQLALAMRMGMGSPSFTIDGRPFDHHRVDQTVTAGAIEEWTIVNSSQMDHPFHLHVWPMQLTAVGERTVSAPTWQNVLNVPAHSFVRVRVDFATHTGRTVFHCHILDHEDGGMMGVVEVGGG